MKFAVNSEEDECKKGEKTWKTLERRLKLPRVTFAVRQKDGKRTPGGRMNAISRDIYTRFTIYDKDIEFIVSPRIVACCDILQAEPKLYSARSTSTIYPRRTINSFLIKKALCRLFATSSFLLPIAFSSFRTTKNVGFHQLRWKLQ